MRCKQGVLFEFFLPLAYLGSGASNLPWHSKWTPSVESKGHGNKKKCVKGIAGYSIHARDIKIFFLGISSPFCVFFHQFYDFWAVMMSGADLVSRPCAELTS